MPKHLLTFLSACILGALGFINLSMQNQDLETLTILHQEHGEETFHIQKASYNLYPIQNDQWELVIVIETDRSIVRSPELEKVVDPLVNLEVAMVLSSAEAPIKTSKVYSQKSGYDYDLDEYLSNFYYFSHEVVDDFSWEILEEKDGGVLARLAGKCEIDNYSNNEPDAEIKTTTFFTHDPELERTVR